MLRHSTPSTAYLLLTLCGLIGSIGCNRSSTLRVYCAASFRPLIEDLAEQFEAEHGVEVQLQMAGSNMLLSQIKLSPSGDVFLPAESWYVEQAKQKGLTGQSRTLGTMHAVLISQQESKGSKTNLADWLEEQPKVSFALPEVAAIGRVTQKALLAINQWETLNELVITRGVYKTTVTEVANDVAMGTVDLGIVWDVVAKRYETLHAYELSELEAAKATVVIAPLVQSKQPDLALEFVEFVADSDFAISRCKAAGLVSPLKQTEP